MSQYLLYGAFKQLSKRIDKYDVNSIGENSSDGYIFEADLEYPDELNELHDGYLLVPEKLKIVPDMLSNYCSNITDH